MPRKVHDGPLEWRHTPDPAVFTWRPSQLVSDASSQYPLPAFCKSSIAMAAYRQGTLPTLDVRRCGNGSNSPPATQSSERDCVPGDGGIWASYCRGGSCANTLDLGPRQIQHDSPSCNAAGRSASSLVLTGRAWLNGGEG